MYLYTLILNAMQVNNLHALKRIEFDLCLKLPTKMNGLSTSSLFFVFCDWHKKSRKLMRSRKLFDKNPCMVHESGDFFECTVCSLWFAVRVGLLHDNPFHKPYDPYAIFTYI